MKSFICEDSWLRLAASGSVIAASIKRVYSSLLNDVACFAGAHALLITRKVLGSNCDERPVVEAQPWKLRVIGRRPSRAGIERVEVQLDANLGESSFLAGCGARR
jgi:hypothetical protein